MGGHGGLNILPQKSWNVYGRKCRSRVEKDEEELAKKLEKVKEEQQRRDGEIRYTKLLERVAAQRNGQLQLPQVGGAPAEFGEAIAIPSSSSSDVTRHLLSGKTVGMTDAACADNLRVQEGQDRSRGGDGWSGAVDGRPMSAEKFSFFERVLAASFPAAAAAAITAQNMSDKDAEGAGKESGRAQEGGEEEGERGVCREEKRVERDRRSRDAFILKELGRDRKGKRGVESMEQRVVDDERFRVGYGLAGSGVSQPWYMSKRSSFDDELTEREMKKKEKEDVLWKGRKAATSTMKGRREGKEEEGKKSAGGQFRSGMHSDTRGGTQRPMKKDSAADQQPKSGGSSQRKRKSIEELRAERLKREEEEREKARCMSNAINHSYQSVMAGNQGGGGGERMQQQQRYNSGFGNARPRRHWEA